MMKPKAIIKFNNGRLALLCTKCRKITKKGIDFNINEMQFALGDLSYLPPIYCKECREVVEAEKLELVAIEYSKQIPQGSLIDAFISGANWYKEYINNNLNNDSDDSKEDEGDKE